MKQLEQVQIIIQMLQRRNLLRPESRITPIDDILQIVRGDLLGGDVQAEDLQRQLRV